MTKRRVETDAIERSVIANRYVTDYMGAVIDPERRARVIDQAFRKLTLARDQFDAIAVTGFSGATIGAVVAHLLNKPLILVRKPKGDESSHSCMQVEGPLAWTPPARYIIVDDFVVRGDTVTRIKGEIGTQAQYVGMYLWRDGELQMEQEKAA